MKITILFLAILLDVLSINAQPLSIDTTFHPYFDFNYPVHARRMYGLYYDENDKILFYGDFVNNNLHPYADIIKMDSYGNQDYSWVYNPMGSGINYMEKMHNNFYAIGDWATYYVKLKENGEKEDTAWSNEFNLRDKNCISYSWSFYLFSDQSMLMGSKNCKCKYETANNYRALMRILPNGKTDTLFNHNAWRNITLIFKESPNKLLLVGDSLLFYDNVPVNRICRIDTSGNLDTTFKPNFIWGLPRPLYIQTDGKILIGGYFNIQNNNKTLSLIRLNTNGSIDSTFNNFKSVNDSLELSIKSVSTACPTSDGGYLFGGTFKYYQGYKRNKIVKTDGNGFIDTAYFNGEAIADSTYSQVMYPNSEVRSIRRTTDDKYYVMGYFTYYNGHKVNPIFRLNSLTNGISENSKVKGELSIFPNPATTQTTITYPTAEKIIMLQIYNMMGQLVYEEKLQKGTNQTTINTTTFKQGIYKITLGEYSSTLIINNE